MVTLTDAQLELLKTRAEASGCNTSEFLQMAVATFLACPNQEKTTVLDLYKALLAERENDGKRLWGLFGIMNVINGALLALAASAKGDVWIPRPWICGAGMIVCLLWLCVSIRMCRWINWWERKLSDLEDDAFAEAFGKAKPTTSFKLFRDREMKPDGTGLSTKAVSQGMPVLVLGTWVLLFFSTIAH